jgi:hypothetical protein
MALQHVYYEEMELKQVSESTERLKLLYISL